MGIFSSAWARLLLLVTISVTLTLIVQTSGMTCYDCQEPEEEIDFSRSSSDEKKSEVEKFLEMAGVLKGGGVKTRFNFPSPSCKGGASMHTGECGDADGVVTACYASHAKFSDGTEVKRRGCLNPKKMADFKGETCLTTTVGKGQKFCMCEWDRCNKAMVDLDVDAEAGGTEYGYHEPLTTEATTTTSTTPIDTSPPDSGVSSHSHSWIILMLGAAWFLF